MGTNFYLNTECCEKCGRAAEQLHIGKSSAGWCFALHVIPDEGINDLADWEARWSQPGMQIVDEYGETISPDEMKARICERQWDGGLSRHSIDGHHCIGHGAGTYDLLPGEFS